jgi:cytochrome c
MPAVVRRDGSRSMNRMEEEIQALIMKKIQYLTVCLLVGTAGLYGQTAPKGDAAKGKEIFDQQCGLCHDATTTDKKMGPGLKGLYKSPKLSTTGKPTNDANVLDKINTGGNGMPPEKDLLSDGDRANVLAYLKTL